MILRLLIFICIFVFYSSGIQAQIVKKKYLALGDSYTIGEGVDYQDRFPVQLANKLNFSGENIDFPVIIAKTGWTTDELLVAIEKEKPENNFDLVTLLIGVNNQYRGRDIENYKVEFEELLQKAIHFAGDDENKVVVISIPDYGATPFGRKKSTQIAKDIDDFNAVNRSASDAYDVQYAEITEISRDNSHKPGMLAEDNLHPSGAMYGLWAEKMLPLVEKIVK